MTDSPTIDIQLSDADLLRHMRPTILLTDQFGTILAARGGSGRPLGYLPEQLEGHHGLEFIAAEDHQVMADMFLGTGDLPIVVSPEPFPLRVVGPDGVTRHWDCVPGGFTEGDEVGWIATLTCRSEQNVSIDAMESFIGGCSSLEIASVVAARYSTQRDPEWLQAAFVLHRQPAVGDTAPGEWNCMNPNAGREAVLFDALKECTQDSDAPWHTLQPGTGVILDQLPAALRAAATSSGLGRCTALTAGLGDVAQLVILRFSNFEYALQGNNLLADKSVNAVLHRALEVEHSRSLLDQAVRQDPLTGVANRLRFEEVILKVDDASNHGVLFVDIDQFKSVNDTFGHAVGDTALRAVADRIVRACRPPDLVARIGGDEFAVILRDVSTEEASQIAQRIRTSMEQPLPGSHGPTSISVTVGIAPPSANVTLTELVRRADHAMLARKTTARSHSTDD